nr:hypothetical protein [Marinicella sp. W31]MDC2879649.1 hypothetical protein [Marinicella sp. W31]
MIETISATSISVTQPARMIDPIGSPTFAPRISAWRTDANTEPPRSRTAGTRKMIDVSCSTPNISSATMTAAASGNNTLHRGIELGLCMDLCLS